MDFPSLLEAHMLVCGFSIYGNIDYSNSNNFQRFSSANRGRRAKDLFVHIHDGDRGATFGDWHYPEEWQTFWNPAYSRATLYDQVELLRNRLQREAEQLFERNKAQWRAATLWSRGYVNRNPFLHPYVLRKKITPYHAGQVRSWLLVPIRNIAYELITLQIIKPCGFKRFWKSTSPKNHMIWLWDDLPNEYAGVIRLCEGYATGCTIRDITRSPVVCAGSAGNMPSVARQLRERFEFATIKICADNDQWGKENVGLKFACIAGYACSGILYWPEFDNVHHDARPTDFNDLFALNGKEAVKRQLIRIKNKELS